MEEVYFSFIKHIGSKNTNVDFFKFLDCVIQNFLPNILPGHPLWPLKRALLHLKFLSDYTIKNVLLSYCKVQTLKLNGCNRLSFPSHRVTCLPYSIHLGKKLNVKSQSKVRSSQSEVHKCVSIL